RHGVFHALGKVGGKDPALVAFLRAALTDKEYEQTRASIVGALGDFGPDAAAALPDLLTLLKTEDLPPSVRFSMSVALPRIGPRAKLAVPTLIALLKDAKRDEAFHDFAQALGRFGPEAREAVPILIGHLGSATRRDQSSAYALPQIGQPAVPGLLKLASTGNRSAR